MADAKLPVPACMAGDSVYPLTYYGNWNAAATGRRNIRFYWKTTFVDIEADSSMGP